MPMQPRSMVAFSVAFILRPCSFSHIATYCSTEYRRCSPLSSPNAGASAPAGSF
jgi:hypothetical protein